MKTNQLMTVAFVHGVIKIKHKTMLGSLKDVETVGNLYRINKGLKPKELEKWLELKDTWEFIETLNRRTYITKDGYVIVKNSREMLKDMDKTQIPQLWDLELQANNKVAYGKMISKYPDYLIKSQKGGKPENRGIWANLHIMLKFAMWMDKDFEIDVIDTFIKGKILTYRDIGGDLFKELMELIDQLEDRKDKDNRFIYINVSKWINKAVNDKFSKGWNDEDKDREAQKLRTEYENTLINLMKMGMIKTYPELKEAIYKLKHIDI